MTKQEAAKIALFKPEEAIDIISLPNVSREGWYDDLSDSGNWMDDWMWIERYVSSINVANENYALVTFDEGEITLYYGTFILA